MNQPLKQARLGRGLSALLGDYAGARNAIESGLVEAGGDIMKDAPSTEDLSASEIAIDRIVPNPKQPRRTFVEAELEELAESIRTKGVTNLSSCGRIPTRPRCSRSSRASAAGAPRVGRDCR